MKQTPQLRYLLLMIALFIASPVIAQAPQDAPKGADAVDVSTDSDVGDVVVPGSSSAKKGSGAGRLPPGLEKDLKREFRKLELDRAQLEQTRDDLSLAEQKVMERIVELKDLMVELQAVIDRIQRAQQKVREDRIMHLIKVCERMPPENAARYIEGTELDVAALILEGMSVRRAAAVVAEMDTEKAVSVSKRFLNRDKISVDLNRSRRNKKN